MKLGKIIRVAAMADEEETVSFTDTISRVNRKAPLRFVFWYIWLLVWHDLLDEGVVFDNPHDFPVERAIPVDDDDGRVRVNFKLLA